MVTIKHTRVSDATARGGDTSLAAGGGGGGNAACPTASDGMNGRANDIAATTEG